MLNSILVLTILASASDPGQGDLKIESARTAPVAAETAAPARISPRPTVGAARGPGGAKSNADASEVPCPADGVPARAGGLIGIAPDGAGTTARVRECTVLSGRREAAQVGHTIEISDEAIGPASGPNMSTADSASYALSLVNVRPNWVAAAQSGEADALSAFVRQSKGDGAAFLANVGIRSGFAATLESYTFAADAEGRATRAVRVQLGVVNTRDGGEFGLLLQAANGDHLSAGLRIASLGTASWRNYLEAVSPTGELVASIRGSDGAFVGGNILPATDLRETVGTPERRYAANYTQVLNLAEVAFARLPRCGQGAGGGALAYVADAPAPAIKWGQVISAGGGTFRIFVKCDGSNWTAF